MLREERKKSPPKAPPPRSDYDRDDLESELQIATLRRMAETTFQHTSASLGDDRQRCFDRRRGFALADVLLNVAPVMRPGPHRSVIVIGLGLIKIARIKSDAVGRSQFSMIVVSDMNTATRPAFGSLYAWTRHAQFGGPRATRQQTSCGRENKCCDQRLCHNRSPPPAPIR